jgi:hypothetical protein
MLGVALNDHIARIVFDIILSLKNHVVLGLLWFILYNSNIDQLLDLVLGRSLSVPMANYVHANFGSPSLYHKI